MHISTIGDNQTTFVYIGKVHAIKSNNTQPQILSTKVSMVTDYLRQY